MNNALKHMICALSLAFLAAACSDGANNTPAPETCTPGELGCECLADMTCDSTPEAPLACVNNLCIPDADDPNPDPGPDDPNPGPNPDPSPTPNPDADPEPDVQPPTGLGLGVLQADARSCEAVLLDPQQKIAELAFSETTRGKIMRRGERLAIAFHATSDAVLSEGSADFVLAPEATDAEGVGFVTSQCFNAQGAPLEGDALTIQDRR